MSIEISSETLQKMTSNHHQQLLSLSVLENTLNVERCLEQLNGIWQFFRVDEFFAIDLSKAKHARMLPIMLIALYVLGAVNVMSATLKSILLGQWMKQRDLKNESYLETMIQIAGLRETAGKLVHHHAMHKTLALVAVFGL